MSVAAVVQYDPASDVDGTLPSYLPVATESEFNRYWRPIASEHGLELIHQFGIGLTIRPPEITSLLSEVRSFALLVGKQDASPHRRKVLERCRLLEELLLGLEGKAVREVFIG